MNVQLSNRLCELRTKSGFSQEELAMKIGVSRQAVSKWERGESLPDTDNLLSLAKIYNLTIDDMLYSARLENIPKNMSEHQNNNEPKSWDDIKSKWRGFPFPIVAVVKFIYLVKESFGKKKKNSVINKDTD